MCCSVLHATSMLLLVRHSNIFWCLQAKANEKAKARADAATAAKAKAQASAEARAAKQARAARAATLCVAKLPELCFPLS